MNVVACLCVGLSLCVCMLSQHISPSVSCLCCRGWAEERGKGYEKYQETLAFTWDEVLVRATCIVCTSCCLNRHTCAFGCLWWGEWHLFDHSPSLLGWLLLMNIPLTLWKQERDFSHLWSDLFTYFSHQRAIDLTLTSACNYNGTPFTAVAPGSFVKLFIIRSLTRCTFQMPNVASACSDQWILFALDFMCECGGWLVSSAFKISF